MGNKKAPKNVTSNVSAAANPAASSTTQTADSSSVLRSSFAPARFGAPLFVSVIQGLDSQHVRIHDTTTGRLRCEHVIGSKATITSLDWGYYGGSSADYQEQESSKKRKRANKINGADPAKDIALAFGTSESEIQIYSPTESKILGVLRNAHSGGIRDFRFAHDGRQGQAYSVGGDDKLVQWDLKKSTATLTIPLPNGPAATLCPIGTRVICASHLAYFINPRIKESPTPYTASTNTVHTILDNSIRSKDDKQFLTVAEVDRFINVFDESSPTLIGSLRTGNEILCADLWSLGHRSRDKSQSLAARMVQPGQALAALNKDGVLEIFPEPFDFTGSSSDEKAESLKARMKQRSRKSAAQLKIVKPDKGAAQIPLINASFQDSNIALAWVEGGANVIFDTVRWRDEETGNLLLKDATEIVKGKSGTGLGAVTMNGVKDMGKSHVDDSHAVVANGLDAADVSMVEAEPEVIDISSAEDESEFEEDQPVSKSAAQQQDAEDDDVDEKDNKDGADLEDVDMEEAEAQDELQEEPEPPSFGDLIRANAPEPINVPNTLTDSNLQSLVPANSTSLQNLPSGMSLGTVLTQSLRTNDASLLETCFHTKDLSTVRATIERLDSSFATNLLQRLAERLHSRPGRAGSLMVWIQWTLVAHGGYLAGQPEVMRKLKSLHKVVKERAGSLQSLLSLKGKLDMLEAQMNLRRSMLERGRGIAAEDEDDDEAVIYVEGQEEDNSEDEDELDDEDSDSIDAPTSKSKAIRDTDASDDELDEDEDEEDDLPPMTNGIAADSEDAGSDSEGEGMINNEASEMDNDSGEELDDDDVDHGSVDTESSDGEASPPPKRPIKGRLSNGVGSRAR